LNWDLFVGPEEDLYAITRQGASGKTEVHVMRASNSYSTFAFQKATGLGATGRNWSFAVSANRDICGALHHGATGKTELHILTAESDYQQFGLQAATGLDPIDESWAFALPHPLAPGFITRHGASGKTEVHVPAIDMPVASFQAHYHGVFNSMSAFALTDMQEHCAYQGAIWGTSGVVSGAITGGFVGAVAGGIGGAVAGCLSTDDVRDRILQYMHERQEHQERHEMIEYINSNMDKWDHDRNTA
jgi:hypothetical protein